MLSSALSIKVFGAYVVLTGAILLLAPDLMLGVLGLAPASDIWIRVLGALALVLGFYYWACGTAGATAFHEATIPGRIAFFVLCAGLVLAADAPAVLLVFGAVDVLGAAWTFLALRHERLGPPGRAA